MNDMEQFNLQEYLKNPNRPVVTRDGLVVVFEEKFNFVKNYPVSQIIDLIEEGATCITPDQLIEI